jgi:hypothetical protein
MLPEPHLMWSRPLAIVRQDNVEQSVPQMEPEKLTFVRIVAPHFVAGIETDGTVRRADRRLHGRLDRQ